MRPQDAVRLPLAIDVSAVTNRMNYDRLFVVKDLVEDAVVTHAEVVESCITVATPTRVVARRPQAVHRAPLRQRPAAGARAYPAQPF